MNDYTTYPTCGTTESNDSIEIKKPFLSEKTSTILKVITYFVGIILAIMLGSALGNKAYNKAFVQGYKQGYNNAKTELTKQDKTIDISKTYQYEFKK